MSLSMSIASAAPLQSAQMPAASFASSSSTYSARAAAQVCAQGLRAADTKLLLDGIFGNDQSSCVSNAKSVSQCRLDDTIFAAASSSARYGEVADEGMEKALDEEHLGASTATCMVDFGSGVGRQILYAFFRFPNLQQLLAAELSPSRSAIGFAALRRVATLLPSMHNFEDVKLISSNSDSDGAKAGKDGADSDSVELNDFLRLECTQLYGGVRLFRSVEFRCCDFFAFPCTFLSPSSVIFLQLDFERKRYADVCHYVQKYFHAGSRLLSYRSLEFIFLESGQESSMPLKRMQINESKEDTFKTSWADQHQFYCYDIISKE